MKEQKEKTDCGAADLNNQLQYNASSGESKGPIAKPRIYRAPDQSGILSAVEDPAGNCYVGYYSNVTRKIRRADLREPPDIGKISIASSNPMTRIWAEAQNRLDEYAEKHKLRELPLAIGGEI